jgi:hypothetical protein
VAAADFGHVFSPNMTRTAAKTLARNFELAALPMPAHLLLRKEPSRVGSEPQNEPDRRASKKVGLAELVAASLFTDDSSAGDVSKAMLPIKVPSNIKSGA